MFEDFKKTNTQEWKEQIIKDLKGGSYDDQLIWTSPENIEVQPFYNSDNLKKDTSSIFNNADWDICEEFMVEDAKAANIEILKALNGGANSILLYLNEGTDLTVLLKNVLLDCIQVHIVLQGNPVLFMKDYLNYAEQINLDSSLLNGTIHYDFIENLARTGNWFESESEDYDMLRSLLAICPSNIRCLCIDSPVYQNAGANMIQQLGITLAITNEYIEKYGTETLDKMAFFTAVGSNYFFEIAKLRALRNLLSFIAKEHGSTEFDPWIHAENSVRNKSIYDPYVNMLRTGSEAMSAVLGGVDSFANRSFDYSFRTTDEFGNRIARNQQSLLKGESYIDKVADPAAGAYYIETLTEQMAEMAFELFKEIESNGGIVSCLKTGFIQERIEQSALVEQESFNSNEKSLLGTNLYPNMEEKMKEEIEFTSPFCKPDKETTIQPIIAKRLSEQSDLDRLNKEN